MADTPETKFAKTVLGAHAGVVKADLGPIVTRLARKIDIMVQDAPRGPLRHDLEELRALTRLLQDRIGGA